MKEKRLTSEEEWDKEIITQFDLVIQEKLKAWRKRNKSGQRWVIILISINSFLIGLSLGVMSIK